MVAGLMVKSFSLTLGASFISAVFINNFFMLTSCSIIPGIGQFNPGDNWELEKTDHFNIYYRDNSYTEVLKKI